MSDMLVENVRSTGLSVKDALLQVAHDICVTELNVSLREYGRYLVEWEADPQIFRMRYALSQAILSDRVDADFTVVQATFESPDETSMLVTQDSEDDFDNDFSRDVLNVFQTFYVHPHDVCLRSLELRVETAKARERTKAEMERGLAATQGMNMDEMQAAQLGFSVKDKRRLAS